jgi:hypothetical protein
LGFTSCGLKLGEILQWRALAHRGSSVARLVFSARSVAAVNVRQPRSPPRSTAFQLRSKWRRRESNTGPAMSQESAGASRSAVSGEESGACADSGGAATAGEHPGET